MLVAGNTGRGVRDRKEGRKAGRQAIGCILKQINTCSTSWVILGDRDLSQLREELAGMLVHQLPSI